AALAEIERRAATREAPATPRDRSRLTQRTPDTPRAGGRAQATPRDDSTMAPALRPRRRAARRVATRGPPTRRPPNRTARTPARCRRSRRRGSPADPAGGRGCGHRGGDPPPSDTAE